MKALLPTGYRLFATQFDLESMLSQVSKYSCFFLNDEENIQFLGKNYNYIFNGNHYSVLVCQTWLIDLLYDLCCLRQTGSKSISDDETLHLISLYNIDKNKKPRISHKDILLYFFGFMGEQIIVQTQNKLFEVYAREAYILEEISKRDNKYKLDIISIFKNITNFDPFDYSLVLITIWGYFFQCNGTILKNNISFSFEDSVINKTNISAFLKKYSTSIENVHNNPLERQVWYSYPFIETDDAYILSNSYIALNTFAHANYWVLRNYYLDENSQDFINAFGEYFELYFKEVLFNCLKSSEYQRIEETNEKRADWIIRLFEQDIIIEQKSALAFIGIKQTDTNVQLIKDFMKRTWSKAVKQLHETEIGYELKQPIKIILLYENYFKCEVLDELFRIDTSIEDDCRYWLITIDEIEQFFYLYKTNPAMAQEVFEAKNKAELTKDSNGRSLEKFIEEKGITKSQYLTKFGIIKKFERIKDYMKIFGETDE